MGTDAEQGGSWKFSSRAMGWARETPRPPPALGFAARWLACGANKVSLSSLKIHEKAGGFLKGKQLLQPRQVPAEPRRSVNRW